MARRKRTVRRKESSVRETSDENVQELAYRFFEERNRQNGWDLDDWLKAEKTLKVRR